MGKISLPVKIEDAEHSTSTWINFVVVRSPSPYNEIIGRLGVRKIQAVPSIAHGSLKFPVLGGILTLRSSKIISLECTMVSGPKAHPSAITRAAEEMIKVAIHLEYPEQTITIGSTLTKEGHKALCGLLRRNLDIFTWIPEDMTWVPRHIAEHRLNIREGCPLVRQKKRSQEPERNKELQEEVEKLVDVGIMKEVHYHSWLLNLVMIDWKVESLCEYPFKCFLDAYKRYHQIKMAKEDEEKTTFITSHGIFCYLKMPFGLKNAGTNYQRLVDRAFQIQIDMNLEVNTKGIKVFPDKVEAILNLSSLNCLKDVQRLNGKLASLNRFLSKSAEKSLPFFKTLTNCTKKSNFQWTVEAETAFKQMEKLIVKLPTLAAPMEKEELIVYLAATREAYLEKVKTLASSFKKFSIKKVPRSENKKVDALSKIASTSFAHLTKQVLVEELKEKYMNEVEVLAIVEEEGNTWMTSIYEYLTEEILPAKSKKARAVWIKLRRYAMIDGVLYKKSFLEPWLRCVRPLQENYVIREIHEGSCNMHVGPRSIVAKAIRTGYYWPTMHKDARKVIRECQDCQVHHPVPRNPQRKLTPITSPCTFYKWGVDIARPFPEGPGKVKLLIVAMDYFTKYIEAKPVAAIMGNQIKKFVWDNIVCSLVERANRSLGEGIKARFDKRRKDWMEEVPHVLWAHRTMIKPSNGDTSFSLTYRMEQAAIREARSKPKIEKYYNSKVCNTSFKLRDLVYQSNDASHAEDGGKLGPKWKGPYEVTKALGRGAYKLKDRNGKILPRTWNVRNLKKCYVHEM
nr:reverse transcriptase domain-containing protein [Tanacetum cinerariifolium]